jgi:hypothetical protein
MKHFPPQRGYVAIVSALIVSGILTALVLAESFEVFSSIGDESTEENHLRARAVANSCGYEGLLLFAEDSGQLASSTPETFQTSPFGDYCTVDSADTDNSTISTHALVHDSFSAIQVTFSSLTSGFLSITTWRDITSTPP